MIKNLFLETVNMSITASVVILAVIVLRWMFRKQPKIYSYLLWSMVLFRLLCPYSFSLDTSAFNLLPAKQTESGQIEYTVPDVIVESIVPQQGTDFLPEMVISPEISEKEDIYVPQAQEKQENIIVMAPQPKIDYVNILALLWMAGVIYMVADNLISLYEVKMMLANSRKLYGNVYKSDVITTAFIIGVISPKIYLPKNLSEEQQRYIIFHEETHLKRKDYLFKYMGFLALALHWFNPLVWLAYYMAEKDMEMSCDEAVIKWIGSSEKRGYSQTLLSLSMPFREYRAMHLAFGEGETKQRIVNILSFKKPRAKYAVAVTAIIAVSGVLLLSNPAMNNAAAVIGDTETVTDFTMVMPDGYYTVGGDLAYTVADNLKKTKVLETEEITTQQGENYIFCKAPEKQYTINFNEDYSKMWLLDETNQINGRVYNIANADSSASIGSFIKANRENTVDSYKKQQITFPLVKNYHVGCSICIPMEPFTVSVEIPQGWHFFKNSVLEEGNLITPNMHDVVYLVNSYGETVGAIGYGYKNEDVDSAVGLMNFITSQFSVTFDTNDWKVWPRYGEIAFTTCTYGNGLFDNYCVLAQKIGVEPYIMMSFIPEKVTRQQAETIASSLNIQTADGGEIRACNTSYWIKPDEPEQIMAETAVSVFFKNVLYADDYTVNNIQVASIEKDDIFTYQSQIFKDYDYVVQVDFTRGQQQFINLLYIDKISAGDYNIVGYVDNKVSDTPEDYQPVTEICLTKTMYDTVTVKDETLADNEYKVLTKGEEGLNYEIVNYRYENGIVVGRDVAETIVIKDIQPETIAQKNAWEWNGTVIRGGTGKLVWPTAAGYLSRGFVDQYPQHNGIDIAAPTGTYIYAADTGVVTKALYTNVGYGIYCIIDHGDYQTLYGMCSELLVQAGQKVQQGQLIAKVGSTGNSTGPHLHFEVKKGNTRYNPYNWF